MRICPKCLKKRDDGDRCPGDGERLLPLGEGDARLGTLAADRFLLLSVLGRGGMGVVYRAHQLATARDVAIKLLAVDEEEREESDDKRFAREARLTAQLRSPNTVTIYDFGKLDSGELFIAMELLEGRSLEQIIEREAPLDAERALAIAGQMCASLGEAHKIGLVHRDVKPSNVIVLDDGGVERVKLVDFGLAKTTARDATVLTQEGNFVGTPAYMPPEMWSASFGEVGPACDVYALGSVLFEMLAARRPFTQDDLYKLLHAHLYEAPPELSSVRADLAGAAELSAIVRRCLAKNPAERPPVPELQAALARVDLPMPIHLADTFVRSLLPPSIPAQTAESGSRKGGRPRASTWVAAGLAAGAIAWLGVMLQSPRLSDVPPPPASVAPSVPAPTVAAAPSARPPAPPPPAVEPPPRSEPKVRVGPIKAIGMDPALAAEVLEPARAKLVRCHQSAEVEGELTLVMVVRPAGDAMSIKVTPESARRFLGCVEPALKALQFGALQGVRFATVSIVVSRK